MAKKQFESVFLQALEEFGTITAACKKSGISRATIDRWKKSYFGFSDLMDGAMQRGVAKRSDAVESALVKNAMNGNVVAQKYFLQYNHQKYKRIPDYIAESKFGFWIDKEELYHRWAKVMTEKAEKAKDKEKTIEELEAELHKRKLMEKIKDILGENGSQSENLEGDEKEDISS